MKSKILLIALTIGSTAAFAQQEKVDYQYSNNSFSVQQQEERYTPTSTGNIFYQRLQAFDSFNRASLTRFVSRPDFIKHMGKLAELDNKAAMYGYGKYVPAIKTLYANVRHMSRLSNDDGHRLRLYEITAPVLKVIDENWGNDIVEAIIDEAYLSLYDYTRMKAASDPEFAGALQYLNMDPIKTNEAAGQCLYSVSIDDPVMKKSNIEVYFTDLALFRKAAKKYTGDLLKGPVSGWAARADESEIIRVMLQNHEGIEDFPAYYTYVYKLKDYGNPNTVQQNLYKDNKWFVWVFRDGSLYYSYMAVPCSKQSKITVYEEKAIPGLDGTPSNDGPSWAD